MPTMTYSLSNFTKTNTDMAAGVTFTAYASGSPVSNSVITSGALYLSSIRTYAAGAFLEFSLGSGSGSTTTFSNNSASHAETVSLSAAGNNLLTAGSGTVTFTVRRTTSGSGNIFNLRANLTGTITLNYGPAYSACGAPTAVAVNQNNVAPGASATLSWSGAKAGTNNAITGYQVYRATASAGTYTLLATVSSTAASGSTSVTAQSTSGSSYFYKILTVGAVSGYNSGQSATYATLTCLVTAPTPPTSVSLSDTTAAAGSAVTLSWSGATAGTNNAIAGYTVYRAAASAGPYDAIGTTSATSMSVSASMTENATYYFKTAANGTVAGYNSAQSTVHAALLTVSSPVTLAAPIIEAPPAGTATYSSRPRVLIELDENADGRSVTPNLDGYTASSAGYLAPGDRIILRRSAALSASGAQSVSVTASDTTGSASDPATRSFMYLPPGFTDSTLTACATLIKAAHINELRGMVDQQRAYYGLAPVAWVAAITANATSLAGWTSHVLEIRGAMEEIATFVNGWDENSTDHNIVLPTWISIPANKPTVAVMEQLREAISLL